MAHTLLKVDTRAPRSHNSSGLVLRDHAAEGRKLRYTVHRFMVLSDGRETLEDGFYTDRLSMALSAFAARVAGEEAHA